MQAPRSVACTGIFYHTGRITRSPFPAASSHPTDSAPGKRLTTNTESALLNNTDTLLYEPIHTLTLFRATPLHLPVRIHYYHSQGHKHPRRPMRSRRLGQLHYGLHEPPDRKPSASPPFSTTSRNSPPTSTAWKTNSIKPSPRFQPESGHKIFHYTKKPP